MISNSKLKPCPFCGDTVNIIHRSDLHTFYVKHDNKMCAFELFMINEDEAKSLQGAYDIWNTRKEKTNDC